MYADEASHTEVTKPGDQLVPARKSLSKGNNSMAATSSKAVLITGANVGLGKEVARQLALAGDFDRIYLACRNADSGRSAADELELITGRSIFTVIRMDLTDLDSVRSALSTLDGELHSVLMNAGGTGGPTPLALTADRVRRSSVPTYWATLYYWRTSSTPGH